MRPCCETLLKTRSGDFGCLARSDETLRRGLFSGRSVVGTAACGTVATHEAQTNVDSLIGDDSV